MNTKPTVLVALESHRGIYLPRDFATIYAASVNGISAETWLILKAGPDHEHYWEAWSETLNLATIIGTDGITYRLHQDEDLFLVLDGMTQNEVGEWIWPEAEGT